MLHRMRLSVALVVGVVCAFLAAKAFCCTSIMVGCKASTDGSVMTSHTCDSHDNSTDLRIVPAAKHKPGDQRLVTRWEARHRRANEADDLQADRPDSASARDVRLHWRASTAS